MQEIYRRTPMPKCDFNKVALAFRPKTLRHRCFPVNLLHIFRTTFPKNTFENRVLLVSSCCFWLVAGYLPNSTKGQVFRLAFQLSKSIFRFCFYSFFKRSCLVSLCYSLIRMCWNKQFLENREQSYVTGNLLYIFRLIVTILHYR